LDALVSVIGDAITFGGCLFIFPTAAALCRRRYKKATICASLASFGLTGTMQMNYLIGLARDANLFS